MKRKIIYSSLFAGLLLLLSIGLNSCIMDTDLEDCACVVTSISNVKTRAGGLVTSDDATIKKVRVFVFLPGGELEKSVLYQEGDPEFTNPFQICELVKGIKDVYIVANETASLNLGAIANKTELLAKLATEITAPIDGTQPLLMTGQALNQDLTTTTSITIPLTRVAAKISLQFKKQNATDDVKITKVSLLSNTGKTPLWEGQVTITGQTYWNYSKTLETPLELLTALNPVSDIGEIYVYENLAGSADKDHATQLEVEALFNNIPTKYRVYINENIPSPGSGTPGDPGSSETTPGDHLYTIKRGHHYKLEGTIAKLGEFSSLLLNTEVLPWNLLQSTFNYEKVNADFQVSPKPPVGSPRKITSLTSNINLLFKIEAPVGAVWSASLTNTAEFMLKKDPTNNIVTSGIVTGSGPWPYIVIGIRDGVIPAAGASTEVVVRVNGYEIDFDKSGATGPGNRLVIVYQP